MLQQIREETNFTGAADITGHYHGY